MSLVLLLGVCLGASTADYPSDAPLARPAPHALPLAVEPALADSASKTPPAPAPPSATVASRPRVASFIVPAVEGQAFNLAFLAFSNLVTHESFAWVSADSIASHFDGRRPWQWDVDYFETNQFGHPYQGALAFTAARSSGLSFWWSALYPTFSSLTWEMFYEVDPPSYNDFITTPVGGVFLGEVLHRAARLLLRQAKQRGSKWSVEWFGALLLEPTGALNRALFNEELESDDLEGTPPFFVVVGAGANFGAAYRNELTQEVVRITAAQANIQGRITYGLPGDPHFRYSSPFSHFDLDFNFSGPWKPITAFFMRGLIAGWQFGESTPNVRGVWGLFGQYDYATAELVRVSSVGVGLGTSLQWRVGQATFLQVSGVLSFAPFAAAGQSTVSDDLASPLERNYHIGYGGQGTLEARLIQRGVGWLRVVGRTWWVVGDYIPPKGWESVSYVTAGPLVRVWGPLAIGGDIVAAFRISAFRDETFNNAFSGATYRLTLNWLSSEALGAVATEPVLAR